MNGSYDMNPFKCSYIPKPLDSLLYIVPENSLSSFAFSVGYILSKCHSNNRVRVKPTTPSLKSRISYNCMRISISNLIKSCYFLPGIALKESIPTYISQVLLNYMLCIFSMDKLYCIYIFGAC